MEDNDLREFDYYEQKQQYESKRCPYYERMPRSGPYEIPNKDKSLESFLIKFKKLLSAAIKPNELPEDYIMKGGELK